MRKCLTFVTILLIVLTAFSCRSTNIQILAKKEQQLRSVKNFYSYLALEYLEYARTLHNKEDWWPAEHFAIKGLRVADKFEVKPENPESWGIGTEKTQEIISARERLNLVINSDALILLPIQTAHLVLLYDCFVSTEAKPVFESERLVNCEGKFYKLLAEIEQYLIDLRAPKQTTQITELEFERFNIYFNLDNDKLTHDAVIKIKELLDYLKILNGNYRILLVGTTDRSGNKLHNDNLAARRTEMVKTYLLSNNVIPELIETRSFGEDYSDIITLDNQTNQSNRKVAIYLLKNSKLPLSSVPLPLIETYIFRKEINNAQDK